tara:strand:+ start:268 stop:456 length:189 start_codon:yes stop_codon:yes gene_type:complete
MVCLLGWLAPPLNLTLIKTILENSSSLFILFIKIRNHILKMIFQKNLGAYKNIVSATYINYA